MERSSARGNRAFDQMHGPSARGNGPSDRGNRAFARGNLPNARGNVPFARGNGPYVHANGLPEQETAFFELGNGLGT